MIRNTIDYVIRNLSRFVLALLMTAALGGPGCAEPASAAPRLRELVTVTSEIVRIGDLVENAGPAADVPVFRAPDLGQTGAVLVVRIAEALRPYDIAGLDTGGLTEVVVTRLSRALTGKDITDRIAHAVANQYGFGDAQNLAVTLDRGVSIMHVEPTVSGDLVVGRMYVEPRTGRFDITFELPGSTLSRRAGLRFTGTVTETVEAATLTRSLRLGDVIKASDVVMDRRPKAELRGEGVPAEQAVGMAVRAAMRSGQAVRADDLIKPQIVQRNEAVTITYQVPGITLTVRGKAAEAGALGDVIGVLNIQSNRTVQATVTGPGHVSITAATPIVAAAATPVDDEQSLPPTQ
jgi:flagella basal body P-ring formation protein FlgA